MTDDSPRIHRRLVAVLALVLVAFAVGACSDDDDGDDDVSTEATTTTVADDGTTEPTEPPGATTTAAGDGGGETNVAVENFRFEPETVTVAAGDTVTWTFEDDAPHNVSGEGFKSDNLSDGDEYSYTFPRAGTFDYVCTLHPGMEGTVEVS